MCISPSCSAIINLVTLDNHSPFTLIHSHVQTKQVLSGALSRGHGELERSHLYDIEERGGREALLRYTIVHFGRQKVNWSSKRKENQGTLHIMNLNASIHLYDIFTSRASTNPMLLNA